VYGLGGLNVGGGGGGTGFTNCACACPIAKHAPKTVAQPIIKNFASAIRANCLVCIGNLLPRLAENSALISGGSLKSSGSGREAVLRRT